MNTPASAWSAGQCLAILRARWRVVLGVFALMAAGTLAAGLLQPRQYQATAQVVLDFTPDPVSALSLGGMALPAFMATQVEVIRSERVAQRVREQLPAATLQRLRQDWQADTRGQVDFERWLSEHFGQQLAAQPTRDGSVIALRYTAVEPVLAAELANAFTDAYRHVALELRTEPARQFSGFFEDRLGAARGTLEEAQARLSSFQAQHGIVVADERMDIEQARLNELSSQLSALQGAAAGASSRQALARGEGADRLPEVVDHPLLRQTQAEIGQVEAQLQQLGTRLGDRHPQLVALRAQQAELRQRLATETQRVAGSVGVTGRIQRQHEALLREALATQRTNVLKMKGTRDEGQRLLRDVDSAQRAHDAVRQRLTQSRLESQSTQGHVQVLARALPPLKPASPGAGVQALLGLLLGGLAATGVALLLELRDRRVRTVGDLHAITGLPMLGLLAPAPARPAPRILARLGWTRPAAMLSGAAD